MDALGGGDAVKALDTYRRRRNEHGVETNHATNSLAEDLRQVSKG